MLKLCTSLLVVLMVGFQTPVNASSDAVVTPYEVVPPDSAKTSEKSADNEIGVLVFYSEGALNYQGAAKLSAYLDDQLASFEEVLVKTGAPQTVSYVGIEPWPYAEDVDSLSTQDALPLLVSDGTFEPRSISADGLWPDKMKDIGADYLVLVKTSIQGDNCGRAYLTTNEATISSSSTNPFAHVQNIDNCDSLAFAHELGHGLGGNHKAGEAALTDYAYGHECGQSGTVMSVDFDTNSREMTFSDPDLTINDIQCGDSTTANMARLIVENVGYIATKTDKTTSPNISVVGFVDTAVTVDEDRGTFSVSVSRTNPDNAITVYITTKPETASSSDYTVSSAQLDFNAGVDQLSFDITINDDNSEEGAEEFALSLNTLSTNSQIDSAKSDLKVTINDNDEAATEPSNPPSDGGSSGGGSGGVLLLITLLLALRVRGVNG